LPPVPIHLRNASSKLGKDMGYGRGYSYNLSDVKKLEYMPEGLQKVDFFGDKS
jgi:putative ATPase